MSARTDAGTPPCSLPSPRMTIRHHAGTSTVTPGRICFWGGVVGAVQAVILLLVPPAVGPEYFSYPLTPTANAIAQVTFAVQHVALVIGIAALLRLAGGSRAARTGLVTAAAGLALLTAMELVAITATGSTVDDPQALLIGTLYGVPTVLTGVGLVVGGIGLGRAGVWTGRWRWLVLATGLYVFVVLLPALMAPFAVGRIVIGVWMLLFAAIGHVLTVSAPAR